MARVPREDYLPAEHRSLAYRDTLLPLVGGRRHNSPLATGLLLTNAGVRADDHVLLVGAVGGYAAALLALLAKSVVALEEEDALVALAKGALAGEQSPKARVSLWLNRPRPAGKNDVPPGEFAKTLEGPIGGELPYDPKAAMLAAGSGKPLVAVAKSSKTAQALRRLAASFTAPKKTAKRRRGLFARLLKS